MAINISFDVDTQQHGAWFNATVVRTTTDTHSGAGALHWTATDAFSGVLVTGGSPHFSGVEAGTVYDFSIWTKGASGAYDSAVTWVVKFYDSAGTFISSAPAVQVPVGAEWAEFTHQLTPPAGASRAGWELNTDGSGAGSVILIDDIAVVDSAAPTTLVGKIDALAGRVRDEFNTVRDEIGDIPAGPQGEVGPAGPAGDDGADGAPGAPGADGDSAYEVAVANGFVGTEAEWLDSLVGPQGEQGIQGVPGADGDDGAPGADGADGADGLGVILLEVGATTPPGGTPTGTIIYRKI